MFICRSSRFIPIYFQPIPEFICYLVFLSALQQPLVDAHESQAQPSILFSNLIRLVVWEIGAQSTTNQKLRSKNHDRSELVEGSNIPKINGTEITHIAIVFRSNFS